MTVPAWIALAGALVTLGVNLAGSLVAWGVLQATVQALTGRIGTLEQEVSAFGEAAREAWSYMPDMKRRKEATSASFSLSEPSGLRLATRQASRTSR